MTKARRRGGAAYRVVRREQAHCELVELAGVGLEAAEAEGLQKTQRVAAVDAQKVEIGDPLEMAQEIEVQQVCSNLDDVFPGDDVAVLGGSERRKSGERRRRSKRGGYSAEEEGNTTTETSHLEGD